MKRKIQLLLITILLLIPINVFAASGSYSISSSSSVEKGSTVSVTFKISGKNIFYWQAYITYDNSKLELVSGTTNFQGESDSISGQSSVSKTLKFKTKKTGAAWIAIAMGDKGNNINSSSQEISYSKVTKTINIKEKKVVSYSSNNFLKSLSIDKYKISPSFNKNTLQYNVELPANTKEIKINATKEDSTAKISGIGKIKVSEGTNKLKIRVTAENGNVREYIIKATVKELDPIEVKINDEKYTVIRKKEQLPKASQSFNATTIKIDNQTIPALKNEITNYVLVGLKSTNGDTNLYIYDSESNKYTLYEEITFNKLTITPIEDNEIAIPEGYNKSTMKINETDIKIYKKDNVEYPIFVGINIETGEKGLYSYDEKENTIQRYINNNNEKVKEKTPIKNILKENTNNISKISDKNTYIIIALAGFIIITYTGILINLIKKNKKTKKIKKRKKDENNDDDE